MIEFDALRPSGDDEQCSLSRTVAVTIPPQGDFSEPGARNASVTRDGANVGAASHSTESTGLTRTARTTNHPVFHEEYRRERVVKNLTIDAEQK